VNTNSYDVVVIGAGVIGSSVAFHLARLGARNVLVLDRGAIGAGTTSQSSGILRTHYSVKENVELARQSWLVFNDFASYLDDEDASCGMVKCGYLIVAPEGDKLAPLYASLQQQKAQGIPLEILNPTQAGALLPIAQFADAALIGYEPEAGFADVYLTTTSFARAARRATNATGRISRPSSHCNIKSPRSTSGTSAPAAASARAATTRSCPRWNPFTRRKKPGRMKPASRAGP